MATVPAQQDSGSPLACRYTVHPDIAPLPLSQDGYTSRQVTFGRLMPSNSLRLLLIYCGT